MKIAINSFINHRDSYEQFDGWWRWLPTRRAKMTATDLIEGLLLSDNFPLCIFQTLLVPLQEVLCTPGCTADIVLQGSQTAKRKARNKWGTNTWRKEQKLEQRTTTATTDLKEYCRCVRQVTNRNKKIFTLAGFKLTLRSIDSMWLMLLWQNATFPAACSAASFACT